VSPELVGRWLYGNLSALNLYDRNTGAWLGSASGLGVIFEFTADGHYTQATIIRQQNVLCPLEVHTYEEGTAVTEAGVLRTYPTYGRARSKSVCNIFWDYDTVQDLTDRQGLRYTWTFVNNAGGATRRLMIGIGDGPPTSEFIPLQ
jgi:hypothetical protein